MILSDTEILEAVNADVPMIEDAATVQIREDGSGGKIVSYGISSYGYDARLAPEYKIFTNVNNAIIDPMQFDAGSYVDKTGEYCIIPPNSYILGRTIEYFHIPRNVLAVCLGKSTYARCGVIVNVTPLEPDWEGYVTLEISNATTLPVKVYAYQGICQFIFLKASQECKTSYADKNGKYQKQLQLQIPIL